MSEVIIRGLNLEQYARFSAEAGLLRLRWEKSDCTLDIEQDMLAILAKYDQNPAMYTDEDGLNYNACGLISEWHELINGDPELLVQYSTISGEVTTAAMYGEGGAFGDMKTELMGETVGDVNMVVEGINLEKYAEICAKIQHASEEEMPGIILGIDGVDSMEQYEKARDAFNAAMEADKSLTFTTAFGGFFAKYGTDHMAASRQHTVDILEQHKEEEEEREDTEENAVREIMKMAVSGKGNEIIPFLKKIFPDDASDNDALDHFTDNACDLFGEAGNKEGARVMLAARYDLVGKEENDDKEEWIDDELDSLFD